MAKGSQEVVGGRFTHYGARGQDSKRGAATSRVGQVTEVEYVFDFNDLPLPSATNEMVVTIPSGAIIERAVLVALTAGNSSGASTDTFVINATRPDASGGTVLLSTTRASLDAINKTVVGAGAGLNASLAGKTQIQVVAALFTAGKYKLNLEYRAPVADAAGVKTY
jgi:hypothetical protein